MEITIVRRPSCNTVSQTIPSNTTLTYQNEYPSPTRISTNVPHVRNTPSKNATKSSGQGSTAEEERNAVLAFIALVPHR